MEQARRDTSRMPGEKSRRVKRKIENPWVVAGRQTIQRVNLRGESEDIDPGVNFFVLALEKLGAKTMWSCEGHPEGFYVLFRSSLKLAQRIREAGYFRVELERPGAYSIRLPDLDRARKDGRWIPWTYARRNEVLCWAASAWEQKLLS